MSWLIQVISSSNCIPCGDTGVLQAPRLVIDPNNKIIARLYEGKENRLPTEQCHQILFKEPSPALTNLKKYFSIISSKLSPDELASRANYILTSCSSELAISFIEYLNQNTFTGSEIEEIRFALTNLPFIPVECPSFVNDNVLTFKRKFVSPSQIIPNCFKQIVELQLPVFPATLMVYHNFISHMNISESNLLRALPLIAIDELILCINYYELLTGFEGLKGKLSSIYETLGKYFSSYNQKISLIPIKRFFIPSVGFCDRTQLLLSSNEDFSPYIHSISSYYEISSSPHLREFFISSGVTSTLSIEQCRLIMEELFAVSKDRSLNVEEQRISLRFLKEISSSTIRDNAYMLGIDNCIHLAVDCVFHDLSWDKRDYSTGAMTHRGKTYHFVHRDVSHDMAFRLCVKPMSHVKLSARKELPFAYQSGGQSEPLTTRLKNILCDYESDVDVFKELTQNADDAQASEVKFLFDYSMQGTESLISERMKSWQGPAIYCYNDSTFSDADFTNITKIAARSKISDKTTIGAFGIGFNTVYHLTDLPSFVSRHLVHIFDPHVSYLEGFVPYDRPGMQIDFVDACDDLKEFQDQFSVYNGVFGCDFFGKKEYPHTLFRLPLRTSEVSSRISQKCFDSQESIRALQDEFVKIARNMIIFLQNIQSIELYDRTNTNQTIKLVYRVTREPEPIRFFSDNRIHFENLLSGGTIDPVTKVGCIQLRATQFLSETEFKGEQEEVLISYASGTEKCFNLVNEIKGLHEVSTLPICSVAIPTHFISMSCENFLEIKCFLFCFLPIPSLSSYPMHINGSFQLQQSRRALHSTSDGSIRTRWNQALISDALPISLVNALVYLAQLFSKQFPHTLTTKQLERYYSFWPESDPSNLLWKYFSSAVALRIIESNAPVFHCSLHPDKWISIDRVSFFSLPAHHELAISFVEFIFTLASHSFIYFVDICPGFANHQIMKIIAERKTQKHYSLERVCKELIFNKLPEIMYEGITSLKLILSTLLPAIKYEPWLKELFVQYPCIPCGEVNPVLRELNMVVSPFSQFTTIFYPEDKNLPHSIFEFLFDPHASPESSQVLDSLDIITTKLPIDVLFERCRMALELHQSDPLQAMKHVNCILDYLNTMKPVSEIEFIRNGLLKIKFIPVFQDQIYLAISPGTQVVFSKPSECYEHSKRVYLTPECHAVTEEVSSLRHALSLLGICPKEVPLSTVLRSILYLQANESKIRNFGDTEISDRLEAVYLFIAQHCFLSQGEIESGVEAENRKLVKDKLTGVSWIWHQTFKQFYSIDQVILSTEYLHFKSKFLPSFPFTQLIQRFRVLRFFEFMNIQKTVTPEIAISIISRMKQHFTDNPLPYKINPEDIISDESGVVIHLINSIVGKSYSPAAFKRVCLLTETCALKIASELYQNDIPWVEFNQNDRATLVHHDITLLSSYNLGAKSKMDTMYNLEWPDFGQHEKITNRIETLLREFPCDVTIFKELLQNADDAGATEIVFVLDCQEYGDETLCLSARYHKKWKQLQKVPSLLVYNNRSFTENDLKGIQEVGIGGKQGKNTIGRFGLGFNSVYHLTRCPCLLTCSEDGLTSNFCVFDPYKEHLNIPPGKLPGFKLQSETSKLALFRDQLSPYFAEAISSKFDNALHNIREKKSFSMFRLPLNAIKGSILNINANVKMTRGLIGDLIKEAPRLLPFIKNVSLIQIYEVNSDGIAFCKSIVNSVIKTQNNIKVPRPIAGHSKTIQVTSKKIIVEEPLYIEGRVAARGSTEVEWLIYHFTGNVEIFFGRSSLLKKHSQIYQTEKLLLFSSIAVEVVCKDCEKPTQNRHLYCHLPFGNPLEFPVHINAPFILDPHRRYVSYQDQLTKHSSWDTIWHGEIMKQVLIPLYFQMLVDLGRNCSNLPDKKYFEWYYSLYPVIQPTDHESNSMEFLQALGRGVLSYIYELNSRILLADDIDQCDLRTWYPLHGSDAGIFKMLHPPFIKLIDINELHSCLVKLRYHLTAAPQGLAQSFMACTKGKEQLVCKFLTPLDALYYMNKNNGNFSKRTNRFPCHMNECVLTVEQIKILLTFVLSHYDKEPKANIEMKQIPLKIDYANNLRKFKQSPQSTFENTYADLLPHLKNLFLAETYDSKLVTKLTDCGYVEKLKADFLSNNLRVPFELSNDFFLLFWSFIVKEVHDFYKLSSLFGRFQLAPITYGVDAPEFPTFTRIDNLRFVATDLINEPLRSLLYRLQCPFLYYTPFDIYEKSRPRGIIHLHSIRNYMNPMAITSEVALSIIKCISMGKGIDVDLTENEAEILRNLFPSVKFNDLQQNDFETLSLLKIFLSDNGPVRNNLVSLSRYNVCFINDSFPICQNLSTKLYDRYLLGILSANAFCNNPYKLIEGICARTNKRFVQLNAFIQDYILQQEFLSSLDFESQNKILKFLFNHLQKVLWITQLKYLAFIHIPGVPPFYFRPTQLYCPNIPLFGTFKKEYLLPEEWAQSNQLYEIMLELGLNTIVSLPLIIDTASHVAANGINCLNPDELISPINALKQYLQSKYSEREDENRCLEQLAQIPFLPMWTLGSFISTQDDSGRDWRLGCFFEAQLDEHMEYCCSAVPILDRTVSFYRPYDEDSQYIFDRAMALLKVNFVPNVQFVKNHLQNLIEICETFSNYQIETFLKKYFYGTYRYLGSCQEEIPEFEHADCILYQCKLFTPQNMVLTMRYTYYPYLFRCPNELRLFKKFLLKLKVAEVPTYQSYNFVLTCIKQSIGSEKLDPNNRTLCASTERAFSYLIFELRKLQPGDIQLDTIYILTVDNELIPCHSESLYYDDDHQLLTRVSKFVQNFKILAPLERNTIGSFAPPECLRIKRLTQRFHQYLLPHVYQNYRVEDELAARLRDRFENSHELIFKALKRIYYHDTEKNLCNVRIRNKEVEYEADPLRDEQLSIKYKLEIIKLISVSKIDLRIEDSEGGTFTIPDACICFLDEVNGSVLFKSDQSCRYRLPIEMTHELNQYFGNLFQKSLIYLETCLVYPPQEIMDTLDNFKIAKLPNYFDVPDQD